MQTLAPEAIDASPPHGDGSVRQTPAPPIVAVAAVVAAGTVLRFVSTSALWLDEAQSVNIAALPLGDMFEALRHDGHPPLYYLLLRGWMEVFGEGDVAVRALSGVFGVATLPLAWIAGRRLAGVAGGRWALVVVALSPYMIRYATETRMYALVMLLVLAGYLLLTDALRSPNRVRLAAVALVSGLLLLTHYWSFFLLGAVGVVLTLRWWRSPESRAATGRMLVALAAGGVLFLPWLGGFLFQMRHTGTPWGTAVRPSAMVQMTLGGLGGDNQLVEAPLIGAVVVVLALLALFAVRSGRHDIGLDTRTAPTVRWELAVVVLTLAFGGVVGFATSSTFQARFAAVVVPLVLLAAAVGISRIPGVGQLVVGGAVVALSLGGIAGVLFFERTQAEVVADEVAARAEPGDVVVYCPDQLGPDYSRALPDGHGLVELNYPVLESPELVDWVDYAERNAAADPSAIARQVRELADGNTIFVVWQPEYRTLDGQCEQLVSGLGLGRGQTLVSSDSGKYFEPANLQIFSGEAPVR
jgi:MFS family permease